MIIDQLPEISSVQTTDELPIERGQTTYKTPVSKIGTAIFASPALTGTPTAPTAGTNVDNTQIATTAFANRAANNAVSTYVRPNLLDNWYFVGGGTGTYGIFPVNQRGLGVYEDTFYSIDRWYSTFSAVKREVLSNGIRLTVPTTVGIGGQVFRQHIANSMFLKGKTYTASIWVTDITGTFGIWAGSRGTAANRTPHEQFSATGLYKTTGSIDADISDFTFSVNRITNSAEAKITIAAVKLELGDTQTLAHKEGNVVVLNELPNFEEQLLRCQTSHADSEDTYANEIVATDSVIGTSTISNIATANSGYSFGSAANYYQCVKVATLLLQITPSSAISVGPSSAVTVATLVSGKRPIMTTGIIVRYPGAGGYILNSGQVRVYGEIPANTTFTLTATYILS